MATCVCFLGEGVATDVERQELLQFAEVAKTAGLKSCLYSGRDVEVETWMLAFDYVKVGSYIEDRGPLYDKTTNQIMYENKEGELIDITWMFWSLTN